MRPLGIIPVGARLEIKSATSPKMEPHLAYPCWFTAAKKEKKMKGIIAYLLGIPIVLIVILYVTGIF